MSVLRLSAVSRLLREQLALGAGLCPRCRGPPDRGCPRGGVHRLSSASTKNKADASERTELLEVLQTRVQQLQVGDAPMLDSHRAGLSVLGSSSAEPPPSQGVEQPVPGTSDRKKVGDRGEQPKRWMEKLRKEQWAKHQRKDCLDPKYRTSQPHPKEIETPVSAAARSCLQAPDTQVKDKKVVRVTMRAKMKDKAPSSVVRPLALPVKDPGDVTRQWEAQSRGSLLEDKEGNMCGSTQLSILCFLETCVFLGELDKAHQSLNYYHRSPARRKLLSTAMYNLLIRGWAKKGSLLQIGHIFTMLDEAGLKPSLGSYAAALECMGRSDSSTKVIQRCLSQMERDGFSPVELFLHFNYQEDERDMVLRAVRCIQPDFQPPLRPRAICSSPLVNDFYSKEPPPLYPRLDFTLEELQSRFEQQLKMESSDTITIDSVEATKPITEERVKARAVLEGLRSHWEKALLQAFRDSKIHLAAANKKTHGMNLYPYLCLLEEQQYVAIMLQCLSTMPPNGESLRIIARDLGTRIYNKFSIRRKLQGRHVDKMRGLYSEYCHLLARDGKVSRLLARELWEQLEEEQFGGSSLQNTETPWPRILLMQLGAHLVDLMVQAVKVQSNLLSPKGAHKLIPVLYHMYSFQSNHQIGFIKPHPIFSQIQSSASETRLTFDSAVMAMLCPPVPWTSPHFGGYVLSPAKLMRVMDGALQHQLLLEKSPLGQLHPVLDSLNQLGICAWRINEPLLDIIVSIFNEKGNEKLDIPPPLTEAPKHPVQVPNVVTSWDKVTYKREMAKCQKKMAEMYSLRMDALYKLSIASHLRDQVFWFPHNMDFRGRTYPCPPYFNHLGSDVTRALLLFADGRALGPRGLDWLKTHLINLTGLKKRSSLQERLEYAELVMGEILDSADRPLTGRRWWMTADEPWQALACCMEIAKASRSPDPTKYVSHFPVHQDGSCNGLQHYAALGRDVIGARSVNLMPCDTPQDVYSGVAQQVEEFRRRDAQQGMKIAQVLEGFICRKVVKQTVMTVVYGVTRYGGRLQIQKRLRELDTFPQEYVWEASNYLVLQVFSGLREMFSGTREIQLWLTESARVIAKSGSTVEWLTPLGLPIVQPYHRSKSSRFQSSMQTITLNNTHDANERPDTVKQKNAFPPNFIHSLDSTHMMLTALHCHRRGLTFVSVHDCFWTHADMVDIMNQVCREQFVALHSQPILHNLSQFLLNKYCLKPPSDSKSKNSPEHKKMKLLFSRVPETGDFDLEQVKHSAYFFS